MKNGGPAFPTTLDNVVKTFAGDASPGISIRDYFAAKMAAVLLANCLIRAKDVELAETWRESVADEAYRMADAMLIERSIDE